MSTNIVLQKIWPHGPALWQAMAQKSPTCLVSFSRGKDALAAFLELRNSKIFEKLILFYEYTVPGLGFVEASLDYYENFFGQKIHRLPHPSLYRQLNNLVFQAPENCKIIEDCRFPNFSYYQLISVFKKFLKIPEAYTATGVRACDSPLRRMSLAKNGPINHKTMQFMPIWNYNLEKTMSIIKKYGVKLPVDYELFNRSFDGFDYRFLKPLKDRFPEDYRKILEFFPLAELEILRREFYKEHIDGH